MKIIYTDWSCHGNPWPWWRAWISDDWQWHWKSEMTTNNVMELTAIIDAISSNDWDIEIRSDSLYAINVIQWLWYPSKNIELINNIKKVVWQRNIIFKKVKWHSWDKMNEEADRLANNF